jgi:hypothetical protein
MRPALMERVFILSLLLFSISAAHCPCAIAENKRRIRSVDFRNFDFGSRPGAHRVQLRDGRTVEETYGKPNSRLTTVKYADFDGDGQEDAAIVVTTLLFGSGAFDQDYYVFTYKGGIVRKVFHDYREQGRGIRIQEGALIIVAPYWDESNPHCCPEYIETIVWRWRKSSFVMTKRRLKRNPRLIDFYKKLNRQQKPA